MKTLTLSIKQKYFNEILAGTKKIETREIRPNNQTRYCQIDEEGYVFEDENGIVPKEYDTLTLLTGAYKGTRPKMVVKIEKAEIYLIEDDKGNLVTYEHQGEEYTMAQIDYHLGEIIEKP